MKKLMLLISTIVVAVCVANPLGAMSSREGYTKIKDDSSGVFEIMNKDSSPIWITLVNDDETILEAIQVNKNKPVSYSIDISKKTWLYVWEDENLIKSDYKPHEFSFTQDKNILVSYQHGRLYPQSGRYGKNIRGFLKGYPIDLKTKSGISMRNNVSNRDINRGRATLIDML